MRFRTTIQLNGRTATGIEVPEEVIEKLGSGKRPPVRVTVNDHTYRSTVAPRGDRYLVGVSAENREGAGVAAGDQVDVEIELDTSPREVAVSPDFAAALEGDADAKRSGCCARAASAKCGPACDRPSSSAPRRSAPSRPTRPGACRAPLSRAQPRLGRPATPAATH
jgi:hypothetical protein